MISKKMADKLTTQINNELYSAYLYMSMSAWATNAGWKGLANWLFVQAKEESCHALIMYNYMNSQQQHVELAAISQPPAQFKSGLQIFEEVLKHENKVTGMINDLVALAKAEKDFASEIFLQWFVSEQVEEEQNATDLIAKFKMIGNNVGGLYILDQELAARMFVMPAPLAAAAVK
jgi:ferritin